MDFLSVLKKLTKKVNYIIIAAVSILRTLFILSALFTVSLVASASARWEHSGCEAEYADLFKKQDVRITLAFGYFDVDRGGTIKAEDIYWHDSFIKNLTRECSSLDVYNQICGFNEDVEQSNKYKKVYVKWMLGPDGLARKFHFTIGHGSESVDDAKNRNSNEQKLRSLAVREMFLEGLKKDHIVLYDGHSRDGGGPDFDPPVLKHGHTDYDWYHKHPKDKSDMIAALGANPYQSKLVVFSSCSSIRWFSQKIENAAPAVGFMGTTDIATLFPLEKIFNSIFNFKCLSKVTFHDNIYGSDLKLHTEWDVSRAVREISDAEMDNTIYDNLVKNLKSNNQLLRDLSYKELLSHKRSSLPRKVQLELGAYEIMKTAMLAVGVYY